MAFVTHVKAYELLSWKYIDTIGLNYKDFDDFVPKINTYKGVSNLANEDFYPDMREEFYSCIASLEYVPNIELFSSFYADRLGISNENSKEFYPVKAKLHEYYNKEYTNLHLYHMMKEEKEFERPLFVYKYYKENNIRLFFKFNNVWYGLKTSPEESKVPESMEGTKLFYLAPTSQQIDTVDTKGSKVTIFNKTFLTALQVYLNTLK